MNIFQGDPSAHVSYTPIIRNVKTKKNIRSGERGMLAYLEYMIEEAQFIKKGDFLLFDGEKAFYTPLIQSYLLEKGVSPFVIEPSKLHQFMNPCDNNFHSLFKSSYYRITSSQNSPVSIPKKYAIARDCYHAISEHVVAQMFVKCGLIGDADKQTTILRLVFEGMGCLWKYDQFHRKNLIAYMDWCEENNLKHLCASINSSILELNGII